MVFSPRSLASLWQSSPRVVTAADVEGDLANVQKRVAALSASLSGLNDRSGILSALVGILSVHNAALALDTAVKAASKDVSSIAQPLAETEATAILNAVQNFQPIFLEALEVVVTKKPIFQGLIGDIPAIVKQDLTSIDTSVKELGQELLGKLPESTAALEQALFVSIDAAFATTLAGYAASES
ncbi:hypothetical protein AURDEDRAFT_159617 [Auricularia subglabra TFB-10046 SS5]|nr:hypothetical protein AURDEDRAFT_159617 [Auricularia subglabra TFB-10046 SS5]